jgi:multidrug efflux pump subunit AcrB
MSTVNDVQSIDSQTIRGYAVLKIYFQPQVHIDAAIAQVGAAGAINSIPISAGRESTVGDALQRVDGADLSSGALE